MARTVRVLGDWADVCDGIGARETLKGRMDQSCWIPGGEGGRGRMEKIGCESKWGGSSLIRLHERSERVVGYDRGITQPLSQGTENRRGNE